MDVRLTFVYIYIYIYSQWLNEKYKEFIPLILLSFFLHGIKVIGLKPRANFLEVFRKNPKWS